jgi:hypothetical protein
VELLGEIPITADECVQLGKAIDLRILVNFKHAWHERDYHLIVKVAERLPPSVLQEDAGLLMYYDNALMRAEPEQGGLL